MGQEQLIQRNIGFECVIQIPPLILRNELSVLQSRARGFETFDCHEIVTVNRIKQARISNFQKTEIRAI